MPARHDLTWEPATKRWKKIHRGKAYTISCKKLGVPPTKEASYQAANEWWRKKQVELDGAAYKPVHGTLGELRRRVEWADSQGERDLAREYRERLAQAEAIDARPARDIFEKHHKAKELNALYPYAPDIQERVDALREFGAKIPEDMVTPLLDKIVGDRNLWDDRFRQMRSQRMPEEGTVSGQVKAWLRSLEARVEAGDFSPDHYDNIIDVIAKFEAFFGGRRPVEDIKEATLEQYHHHLLTMVAERRRDPAKGMSPEYATKVFRLTKQFIKYCWSKRLLELPRNFAGKFSFGAGAKRIETMTVEEFRELYEASTGQTRLHLLLMANCGFYPIDISDLKDKEVEWEAGRIVRKRSKTDQHEDVPTVDYKLWPETFALLKRYRSGTERALLTKTGRFWVHNRREDGKLVSCNSVESNYTNLKTKVSKAREENNLPAFKKPLSLIRKTSASLIESKAEYGRYVPHFLGHSPKSVTDKHYRAPSGTLFDEILDWLGRTYMFVK